ncbi:uncharacterized protein LOC113291785 [Papaver somniferum]|uniref:uncharacterized protein LOC113291785 n=1 Tax=Papaver somniferum TaxID=3469 RepID=UPI000E6F7AB2|nr:uncharacterized protein LOC113291785 [Papaver somniferum]
MQECFQNTPPVKEFKVEYDFCVASLMANPKSKDADLRGLGVISMQHVYKMQLLFILISEVLLGLALPSPLTKQNGDFFQLTGISLAITNMIK